MARHDRNLLASKGIARTMIQQIRRLSGMVALFFVLFGAAAARAHVHIDVNGNINPLPIAVTELQAQDGADPQVGVSISDVVSSDLRNSGAFRPLDPASFIQAAQAAAD